jgi:hypothetical protein
VPRLVGSRQVTCFFSDSQGKEIEQGRKTGFLPEKQQASDCRFGIYSERNSIFLINTFAAPSKSRESDSMTNDEIGGTLDFLKTWENLSCNSKSVITVSPGAELQGAQKYLPPFS